jgi:hypothetical protein
MCSTPREYCSYPSSQWLPQILGTHEAAKTTAMYVKPERDKYHGLVQVRAVLCYGRGGDPQTLGTAPRFRFGCGEGPPAADWTETYSLAK